MERRKFPRPPRNKDPLRAEDLADVENRLYTAGLDNGVYRSQVHLEDAVVAELVDALD